MADQAWQERGNCLGGAVDMFPTDMAGVAAAKAVCVGCAVTEECLDYAQANGEDFGIWGGLSARGRRRLRTPRSRAAAATGPPQPLRPHPTVAASSRPATTICGVNTASGYDVSYEKNADQAPAQVASALSSLREAQERADKHTAVLSDRLVGVLRPPRPGGVGGELQAVRPDCSPLAEELWLAVRQIQDLADRLSALGDRIDL